VKVIFNRLRRKLWTFNQPLVARPSEPHAPVSDLFVWRCSDEWQTNFELVNLASLFREDPSTCGPVSFYFFDAEGSLFRTETFEPLANRRQTIDLAPLIGCGHGEVGTFAVFHLAPPKGLSVMGAHLAERGYVSYQYLASPLRAFVHGNLDAISIKSSGSTELLGGAGLRTREYRLQFDISNPSRYEAIIVNPSAMKQSFIVRLADESTGQRLQLEKVELNPGAIAVVPFGTVDNQDATLVVRSKVCMARPLMFRFFGSSVDVFHG